MSDATSACLIELRCTHSAGAAFWHPLTDSHLPLPCAHQSISLAACWPPGRRLEAALALVSPKHDEHEGGLTS